MCIIVVKKKDQTFVPKYIDRIYDMGNKDGLSLMYVDKVDGVDRVIVKRSMAGWSTYMDMYEKDMNRDIAVHMRNASFGMEKNIENCHGIKILSLDDGDKIDLFMMHNGRFPEIQVDRKMSDSWNFGTKFLAGYLKKHPTALQDEDFQYLFAGIIGSNKLVFLDNKKRFTIINADLGAIHPTGVWVSTKSEIKLSTYTTVATSSTTSYKSQQFGQSQQVGVAKDAAWTYSEGTWEQDSDNRLHFRAASKTKDAKADTSTDEKEVDTTDNGILTDSLEGLDEAGLQEVMKAIPSMSRVDLQKMATKFHKETLYMLKQLHPTEPEAKLRLLIANAPWDAADLMMKNNALN